MQRKFEIKKINGEDILFIYLNNDWNNEFGKINENDSPRKKVKFKGNKIKLIMSGVAVATLTITPFVVQNSFAKNGSNTSTLQSSSESQISVEDIIDHAENLLKDFNALEISNTITEDFSLPLTGEYNSEISWVSDNSAIIIDSDLAQVTRPTYAQGDISAQLIATLNNNGLSQEKTFDVTILKESISSQEKANIDYENINLDFFNVTGNFTLPTESQFDSIITWQSDNENIIAVVDNMAIVNRPDYFDGNADVRLVATIRNGDVSLTKDFYINVERVFMSPSEASDYIFEYIDMHMAGYNEVSEDFPIITYLYGFNLRWESYTSYLYVNNNGIVSVYNRPSYAEGPQWASLDVSVVIEGQTFYRSYNMMIKNMPW